MALQGTWALTGAISEEIIAADEYRNRLTIQSTGVSTVHLALGKDAVVDEGIELPEAGDFVDITGDLAALAVNAIGTLTTSKGEWWGGAEGGGIDIHTAEEVGGGGIIMPLRQLQSI